MKQRAKRYPQPEIEEPAPKKQKTKDQVPLSASLPRVNPDDTTRIQKGQASTTTVQEAMGFSDIPAAAHELAAILQFETSYELVEWLPR